MHDSKYFYVTVALLTACLLYVPGLNGPFLLDDYSNSVNSYSYGFNWHEMLTATFSNQSGVLRRPLANLSFIINAIIDKSSFGYKLANLVLHLVTGVIIFSLTRRLSSVLPNIHRQHTFLVATIVAAAWLLHPIQVSTVLYAVQRMTILSALFVTSALLLYVRFRIAAIQSHAERPLLYGVAYLICWILALASKENAALLPLFVLAIELSIFKYAVTDSKKSKQHLHVFLLLLVYIPLAVGALYTAINFSTLTAGYAVRDFSLLERLYTEIHALIFYLKIIFIPDLSLMGIYHDDFHIQHSISMVTTAYLAIIISSILAAILIRRRFPLATLGILWFFTAHLLESTFLPLELVFEHRNYLALAGICLLIAEPIINLLQAKTTAVKRTIALSCLGLFLAFTTLLTYMRVDSWSSRDKLFTLQVIYHPDSPRVLMEMINIDVPRQQFDLAHSRIDRIAALTQDQARSSIMRLIVNCYENRHSEQNLTRAMLANTGHPMWFKSTNELISLSQLALHNKCSAYSNIQIINLLLTAVNNHSGRYASQLHSMAGQLYVTLSNINSAREQYQLAYQADNSQLQPLIVKTYLELNSGLLNEAETTILTLKKADVNSIVYPDHLISELEQHLVHARNNSK